MTAATYDDEPMVDAWLKVFFSVPAWFVWMFLTGVLAPPIRLIAWGDSGSPPDAADTAAAAAGGWVLLAFFLGSVGTAVGLARLLVRGPRARMLSALLVTVTAAWVAALFVARLKGGWS